MQSKISCFNKTIFKKNLTRFWPFAVIYGVYLMMVHPMVMYLEISNNMQNGMDTKPWQVVGDHFTGMTEPVSVFLVAIVIAAAVFGYLYQSRSANMIHAFPVTRTELFVTNYLSGLALMAIPQLLAALATNLVILGKANSMIWAVWTWFGITFGETIFFFGFACFVVMFTGQLLAAGLFYMIWNFLYLASVMLINAVGELMIYGLSGALISAISHPLFPVAYLLRKVGFYMDGSTQIYHVQGISTLLIYAGVGLILTAFAWYIYQKRRIECAGDFLSMKWTMPVFRWGTAFVVGAAGALCWTYLTGEYTSQNRMVTKFVIFLVICSAVLFFVAEMFIEKSFRVLKKRIAMECVSCVAVLLIGVGLLQLDVFGIESYVPQTEEIRQVALSGNGNVSYEDASDVEQVRALHKLIVDHRKDQKAQMRNGAMEWTETVGDADGSASAENAYYYDYIGITYTLNNGKNVSRSYQIVTNDTSFKELLTAQCEGLFNDPEALKRSYFGMNYKELNWQLIGAGVDHARVDERGEYFYDSDPVYGSQEDLQKLFDAVLADFDAGAFSDYGWNGASEVSATMNLTLRTDHKREEIRFASDGGYMSYFDGEELPNGTQVYSSVYLTDRCTNIINALIELGEIESADDLRVPEGDDVIYEKY